MEFVWFIIIGFLAGLIARALVPGADPMGWILTTVLGIVGAVVAGFIGRAAGWYQPGVNGPGLLAAVVGAVVVLLIWRAATGGRTKTTV